MTNDECRMPESNDEARNTKLTPRGDFIIRHLTFLRHSSFGFRHSGNHALATIAQIGMRFACADGRPMPPATRALFVRRFRHRNARFFRLVDRQITHNEKFFQFLLGGFSL